MLKVPEGTLWTREKPLGEKTIRLLIELFSQKIADLGLMHQNTSSLDSEWLYNQPPFSLEQAKFLNRYLRVVGLELSQEHRQRNALLCFRYVDIHDDTRTFIDRDRSIVYIPLARHEGAVFKLYPLTAQEIAVPITNGSVIIFDQNSQHQVVFPSGSHNLKFGLSFLVDRIPGSPSAA